MDNTMTRAKKSTQPVLVDIKQLRKAQRLIKANPSSGPWKLCMHMAKQAYGVVCKPPMPEIGERNGSFICTHVNIETGEYIFLSERSFCRRVINDHELSGLEAFHD